MRTEYRIDRFQDTYFVIDGFDQLFEATRPDFAPLYRELEGLSDIAPDAAAPGDRMVPTELAA
jgi:phenylalanine-4-hydroxylase